MEELKALELLSIIYPVAIVVFIIAIGVVLMNQQFQKNIIQQQLKREELKGEHQKELLNKTIRVQEGERKRIASDLHDELGAILSISKMQLIRAEKECVENTTRLTEIKSLIETALASTRRISHELMPLQLEKMGLEKALLSLLNGVEKTGDYTNVISIANLKLPWMVELGLYRIYSELINNTVKHAKANSIHINISLEEELLYCKYVDNGIGLPKTEKGKGLGMASIENRVKSLEGEWEWRNGTTEGFHVTMKIPLTTSNQ